MSEASSIPSWARVGAKVVCVRDRICVVNDQGYTPAVKGAQYEIVATGKDFIRLAGFADNHWHALNRFRPLVTRSQEQDVARFRKLLVGKPERADA